MTSRGRERERKREGEGGREVERQTYGQRQTETNTERRKLTVLSCKSWRQDFVRGASLHCEVEQYAAEQENHGAKN